MTAPRALPADRRRTGRRWTWAVVAVAAVVLAAGHGCAVPNARDDLDRDVTLHHIDLRWGRLEHAAQRVAPPLRGAFVQAWATRLQDIELQDIEVTVLVMADDQRSADVVVAVTFVDRATMQVRTAQLAERWHRGDDGWRATTPATPATSATPVSATSATPGTAATPSASDDASTTASTVATP